MKNLIIISAPSGSGKTTLCRAIEAKDSSINFSISSTTREMRIGEVDGLDYHFITKNDFKAGINQGIYVEWEKIHGDFYYGTRKSTIEQAITKGRFLLLELDVKGAMKVKKIFPKQAISIFVEPPSLNDLKVRLQKRGTDSEDRIKKRLERLKSELRYKVNFDYQIINDDLNQAVTEIFEIIKNENKGVYHGT